MVYKITVVTGTRADYGLLRELLFRLKNNDEVFLDLLVTGSHLSDAFGNTQDEISKDGFTDYTRIPIPIDDDSKCGMAKATGVAICKYSDYLSVALPDIVVVLGDRYEILSVVIAARMIGIPVAHISGGDVTEGAIDDSIRHSITKMSQIHFPGCEQSRNRIIQMGEQPEMVFNVGEPGVENCLKIPMMDREELKRSVGFAGFLDDYSIVTFHPVTMENNTGEEQVKNLIRALDAIPNMNYIITLANADAGGRSINDLLMNEMKRHDNWCVVSSLGVRRYLSAMKYSKIVIGNSSSGIVEAPAMKVPTVNIGDRQKGRMLADSVICCAPTFDDIKNSLKRAMEDKYQNKDEYTSSPFGDGHTSKLIEKYIMESLRNNRLNNKKRFYDIDF